MARLIDADEILDQLGNEVKSRENFAKFNDYYKGIQDGLILAKTKIREMPTIEHRRGKWLAKEYDDETTRLKCSECKFIYFDYPYEYCPHCGADMRGDSKCETTT